MSRITIGDLFVGFDDGCGTISLLIGGTSVPWLEFEKTCLEVVPEVMVLGVEEVCEARGLELLNHLASHFKKDYRFIGIPSTQSTLKRECFEWPKGFPRHQSVKIHAFDKKSGFVRKCGAFNPTFGGCLFNTTLEHESEMFFQSVEGIQKVKISDIVLRSDGFHIDCSDSTRVPFGEFVGSVLEPVWKRNVAVMLSRGRETMAITNTFDLDAKDIYNRLGEPPEDCKHVLSPEDLGIYMDNLRHVATDISLENPWVRQNAERELRKPIFLFSPTQNYSLVRVVELEKETSLVAFLNGTVSLETFTDELHQVQRDQSFDLPKIVDSRVSSNRTEKKDVDVLEISRAIDFVFLDIQNGPMFVTGSECIPMQDWLDRANNEMGDFVKLVITVRLGYNTVFLNAKKGGSVILDSVVESATFASRAVNFWADRKVQRIEECMRDCHNEFKISDIDRIKKFVGDRYKRDVEPFIKTPPSIKILHGHDDDGNQVAECGGNLPLCLIYTFTQTTSGSFPLKLIGYTHEKGGDISHFWEKKKREFLTPKIKGEHLRLNTLLE